MTRGGGSGTGAGRADSPGGQARSAGSAAGAATDGVAGSAGGSGRVHAPFKSAFLALAFLDRERLVYPGFIDDLVTASDQAEGFEAGLQFDGRDSSSGAGSPDPMRIDQ